MKHPRLTAQVVNDPDRLASVIDRLFIRDRQYRRHRNVILTRQRVLMDTIDAEQFNLYLDVEAATNERLAWMLSTVAKWAFNEGQRSR